MPLLYEITSRGASADASLLFEGRSRLTHETPAKVANWTVMIDAATQRELVNCGDWPFSEIVTRIDGSLLLRLHDDDGDVVYRIDPVTRTYRDLGEGGAEISLSQLGHAVQAERAARAKRPPAPLYRRISPDGTIKIDFAATEWGNSKWVYCPRVTDLANGQIVLDLWETDWDATAIFPKDRVVELNFRRYHFSGDLTIELDLARDVHRITREPGAFSHLPSRPLGEAAAAMEESGRRIAAGRPVWTPMIAQDPWAAWRTALLTLIVAALLIAAATFLSLTFAPQRSAALRPSPQGGVQPHVIIPPRECRGEPCWRRASKGS